MRIVTFKVPGKVQRAHGTVELILNENNKVKIDEEEVPRGNASDIPRIAKELSDGNDVQRSLAKGTLLNSQQEASVEVELRYLTD